MIYKTIHNEKTFCSLVFTCYSHVVHETQAQPWPQWIFTPPKGFLKFSLEEVFTNNSAHLQLDCDSLTRFLFAFTTMWTGLFVFGVTSSGHCLLAAPLWRPCTDVIDIHGITSTAKHTTSAFKHGDSQLRSFQLKYLCVLWYCVYFLCVDALGGRMVTLVPEGNKRRMFIFKVFKFHFGGRHPAPGSSHVPVCLQQVPQPILGETMTGLMETTCVWEEL